MIKSLSRQPKWLASLFILVAVILLAGSCTPANQPPVISSLTASEEQSSPSGSCQVECIASDPNGDELVYTWSATKGSISGEAAAVTWMAPEEPGSYIITVKVTDSRGGEATAQMTVRVASNHPPVIVSLTVPQQRVRRATTSTIECLASDPDGDELVYTWSATGGSISGEGPAATWVAPNVYETCTITVTVADGSGGQATKSINIVVTCCP